MGELSLLERLELKIKQRAIWEEALGYNFDAFQIPEAANAIGIFREMQDIRAAANWLERLANLTPSTLPQFEIDLIAELSPDTTTFIRSDVEKLLTLARWLSGSTNHPSKLYKSHTQGEESRALLIIKNKIKQTSQLISSYDVELRNRLFKAVNDDDFKKLETLLKENPGCSLNVTDKNGFSLLSLAYLRRAYFNSALPEKDEATFELEYKRTEQERQKDNEKIFLLLLEKSDINAKIMDGKSILHLAISPGTPPSDLVLFLLKGANPNVRDLKSKNPLDYLMQTDKKGSEDERKLKNKNKHLYKAILQLGIPELFNPVHYELLEEVFKDTSEKNSLFYELIESYLSKLKTNEAQGLLLYNLPIHLTDKKQIAEISDKILSAGLAIAKINKIHASNYYQKAAELGNINAMQHLAMFYHFESNPRDFMKAIEWYAKSYPLSSSDHDRDNIIHNLNLLIQDATISSDVKQAALTELKQICTSHLDEKLSPRNLIDLITYYSLIKSNPDTSSEEVQNLFKQINSSWEDSITNAKTAEEEGELLYLLLSNNIVDEKNIPIDASHKMHAFGIKMLDSNEEMAINCIKQAAKLEHPDSIWFLALYYHNHPEKKDLIASAELYFKYGRLQIKKPVLSDHEKNPIQGLKMIISQTKDQAIKTVAIKKLIGIYNLRWEKQIDLFEQIQFLQYLEKVSDDKKILNKLLVQILEKIFSSDLEDKYKGKMLFHLLTIQPESLADRMKALIEKEKLTNAAIQCMTQAVKTLEGLDQQTIIGFYEVLARWQDPDALYNLGNYYWEQHNFLKAVSFYEKSYLSSRNDDVRTAIMEKLKNILSENRSREANMAAADVLERINTHRENDILKILNKPLEQRDQKSDGLAMMHWIETYGNAEIFLKMDQKRKQLISHRILEYTMPTSIQNPIAIELEKKLIDLWKKDTSPSSKKLLSHFFTKKIGLLKQFDNAEDEIKSVENELAKLKPFYHRLFSVNASKKIHKSNMSSTQSEQKISKK